MSSDPGYNQSIIDSSRGPYPNDKKAMDRKSSVKSMGVFEKLANEKKDLKRFEEAKIKLET